MEIIHLFYLLALFLGWFDRTFFQVRVERVPALADFLANPEPLGLDASIKIPRPKRPMAILVLIALSWFLAGLLCAGLILGPLEFLMAGLGVPNAIKAKISLPLFFILQVVITFFFAAMWIGFLWFPTLELTRDALICRMGDKTMKIPWIALDCLPREPYLEAKSEPKVVTFRVDSQWVVPKLVAFEEGGKRREPWAVDAFPIHCQGSNGISFQNRFLINHLTLARFLSGVAATQVGAGYGLNSD